MNFYKRLRPVGRLGSAPGGGIAGGGIECWELGLGPLVIWG